MNPDHDDDALTWPGAADRTTEWAPILVALIAPVAVILLLPSSYLDPILNSGYFPARLLILVSGLLLPLFVLLFRPLRRKGTWRVAEEGVTYRPPRGPEIMIPWAEVSRVRWRPSEVVLQGSGARIALSFRSIAPPVRDRITDRVRRRLSPDFDLSRPPPELITPPRALQLTGIAALWTTALGTALAPWYLRSYGYRATGRSDLLAGLWGLALAATVCKAILGHRRSNGTWIERRPHIKGQEGDKGSGANGTRIP